LLHPNRQIYGWLLFGVAMAVASMVGLLRNDQLFAVQFGTYLVFYV
jgi:hypothetical protein